MVEGPAEDPPGGEPAGAGRDEPPRRGVWSSPWLWTAVVVVVLGGALVVSLVAGRPPDPSADDLSAFCPAVRAYWEDTPLLTTIDLDGTPDYTRVKADAARLRQTAPPSVATDVASVADGIDELADRLAALAARQQAQPGSVPLEEVQATIERAGRGRERASDRLSTFIQQGCGIDLAAPPPTSAPVGGPGSSAGPGPPVGPSAPTTTVVPRPGQAGPPTITTPATGR
ncbi:MAG: hypothetical protein U0Q07_07650 [Acidimicrobiales bacterium]